MSTVSKNYLLIASISIGMLICLAALPFSIYGQDGYFLWFPILSEYLKSDLYYHSSQVIFDGQNLAGIYGDLPFWKVLRLFNPNVETFLNLTHGIFVILLSLLLLNLVKGIRGRNINAVDIVLIFTFALLSPIVTNRAMAGHLNLLFGVLPFFVFAALMFNKSIWNIIFSIFCVWCAMSTQAFQILSYHIFYVPILIGLLLKFEKQKKKYLLISIAVFAAAFLFNFSNFMEMLHHATNSNNLRNINTNMVYSYTVSTGRDLYQFLFSGQYPEILGRGLGFFHEVNYPIGAFLLFFFYKWPDKKIQLFIFFSAVVFYLFCMNIIPFNLFSELPNIKPFRVPQRVFMVLSLFVPIWFYSQTDFEMKMKDYLIFFALILVCQFIDYSEILAFVFVMTALFVPKLKNLKWATLVAFIGLYVGSLAKIEPSTLNQRRYEEVRTLLKPMTQKFNAKELRTIKFHFDSREPALVNYVGQTMGIATLEGYGHPPSHLLSKFGKLINIQFPETENNLYLGGNYFGRDTVLKAMGVQKIVSFGLNNELIVRDL